MVSICGEQATARVPGSWVTGRYDEPQNVRGANAPQPANPNPTISREAIIKNKRQRLASSRHPVPTFSSAQETRSNDYLSRVFCCSSCQAKQNSTYVYYGRLPNAAPLPEKPDLQRVRTRWWRCSINSFKSCMRDGARPIGPHQPRAQLQTQAPSMASSPNETRRRNQQRSKTFRLINVTSF